MDSKLNGYSAKEVAAILNAYTRLSSRPLDLFDLATEFLLRLPATEFVSEKDLGVLCNAFARMSISNSDLFENVSGRIEAQLGNLGPQSCGNICHAYGKLGLVERKDLISKVGKHAVSNFGKRLSPQELSNILYSVANLGITDADVVEPLIKRIAGKISRFNSIEMAAVCTSLTKLSISDRPLMRKISDLVIMNHAQYSAYEMTAVLHAFSQLEVAVPKKLFSEIALLALTEMNSHTACIALGAYSRVSDEVRVPYSLLDKLCAIVRTENETQYLANVIFSISRFPKDQIGENLRSLLVAIEEKLTTQSPPSNSVNLNQLIYALNKLGRTKESQLYPVCVAKAIETLHKFEGSQVCNILYAIAHRSDATLSHAEERLATRLVMRLADLEMNPQLFSSAIDSVARLGCASETMWHLLEERISVTIPESSRDDLTTLSALIRADRSQGASIPTIIKRIQIEKLNVHEVIFLTQTTSYLSGIRGDLKDISPKLMKDVSEFCLQNLADISADQLIHITGLVKFLGPCEELELFKYVPQVPRAHCDSVPLLLAPQRRTTDPSAELAVTVRIDELISAVPEGIPRINFILTGIRTAHIRLRHIYQSRLEEHLR